MLDLTKIEHVYLYPGVTDFRNGLYGLRKLIGDEIKEKSIYVFANKALTQIKIIEIEPSAMWLYQKKLNRGKFMFPKVGDKTELTKKEISLIIEGITLINKIETNGKETKSYFY